MIEEALPLLPPDMAYKVFDFGLHVKPDHLRRALQDTIDASGATYDTLVLGYGICAMAVVGLKASQCTLVVPRVDDCIAIFLGSSAAYKEQARKEPGTYYLTKGWIEVNDTLLKEFERQIEQFGQERAERLMGILLRHYKRLVYIDTGHKDQARYREYARRTARTFNLRYEEICGSNVLVRKMILGPWDEDFVIASPGHTLTYSDFKTSPE